MERLQLSDRGVVVELYVAADAREAHFVSMVLKESGIEAQVVGETPQAVDRVWPEAVESRRADRRACGSTGATRPAHAGLLRSGRNNVVPRRGQLVRRGNARGVAKMSKGTSTSAGTARVRRVPLRADAKGNVLHQVPRSRRAGEGHGAA